MMRLWVVAWVLALSALPIRAATHWALLVGVNEYPTLPSHLQLRGPRNDVENIKQALISRGFLKEDAPQLTQLTGAPGAANAPTRASILAALAKLERSAKRGDFVFIYFAGHGSQQPVAPTFRQQEPDGMSEIFLPQDVGRWTPRAKPRAGVLNAILDHELSASIQAIRAKGAFTWAVFDACNSSTLASSFGNAQRGDGDSSAVFRSVSPRELGIPEASMAKGDTAQSTVRGVSAEKPLFLDDARQRRGDAPGAFFYSAQTTEFSVERALTDARNTKKYYGVYSYVLAQRLRDGFTGSYEGLTEQIRLGVSAPAMQPVYSTPSADGDGLLMEILQAGGKWSDPWPREWSAYRVAGERAIRLQAGALHGLRVGQHLRLSRSLDGLEQQLPVRISALGAKTGLAIPLSTDMDVWDHVKDGDRWLASLPRKRDEALARSELTRKRAANLWHLATAIARKSALKDIDVQLDSKRLGAAFTATEGKAIMTLRNLSMYPMDVTVLYIDEHSGISVLFPTPGRQNRIEGLSAFSTDEIVQFSWTRQDRHAEHLVVLAAPSVKGEKPLDLTFWAQRGLTKAYVKQQDQNREPQGQYDSLWASSGGVGGDVQATVVSVKVQAAGKKR